MDNIFFWLADNLDLWRHYAIAILAVFVLGCLYFSASVFDRITK